VKCKVYFLQQTLPSGTKNFVWNFNSRDCQFHFTTNLSRIYFSHDPSVFERMLEKLTPMRFKHPFVLKTVEFNLEEP